MGAGAKASLRLKVRSADFGPLLDLKPADTLAQKSACPRACR